MHHLPAKATKILGDKATLERMYLKRGLSAKQIGEKIGCSMNTVLIGLEEHGIPKRDKVEARQLRHKFDKKHKKDKKPTKRRPSQAKATKEPRVKEPTSTRQPAAQPAAVDYALVEALARGFASGMVRELRHEEESELAPRRAIKPMRHAAPAMELITAEAEKSLTRTGTDNTSMVEVEGPAIDKFKIFRR